MDKTERLAQAFNLELPDRPPILGGWLAAPDHVQTLTGCSEDEYWDDPFHWGLEAERVLGSDGVLGIVEPIARGDFRIIDGHTLEMRAGYTMESVLAEIETMPTPEEIRENFDEEAEYAQYAVEHRTRQAQCGDILWCPPDWEVIPKALWYQEFGYENALMTLALHPDRYRKLIQVSAERGRLRAVLTARAIREGIHPGAILTGEDLCSQRGPLVSPDYLRREYFHLVEYALEPLLEIGAKIVWHCDGDCRPLLDDVLACNISGLQGFQCECGMDLEWIVERRTRGGDPLLIFGPMSVTSTLPNGTPDDVRTEVRWAMNLCRDKASLIFFSSNTVNPDVPLENIQTFWQTVLESTW
ncbi:MAG: uroporphyrinogen decarboxylase family protein [Chloroflexota bacterium]|nr:uroporphyrinogen decarboxylase family protein [Chloroflexota bacterium]